VRILIPTTEARPIEGGIARCLAAWASGLADAGHEVRLLAFLREGALRGKGKMGSTTYDARFVSLAERTEVPGDRFPLVRRSRSGIHLGTRVGTIVGDSLRAVWEFKPDIVFQGTLNSETVLLARMVRWMGVPLAAGAYASELMPARNPDPKAVRRRLALPDVMIAISHFTRGLVEAWGVPRERIRIVHPAVEAPVPGAEEAGDSNSFARCGRLVRLLSVCRLVERKGVQDVLEAVGLLRERGVDVRYEVVGAGPFRAVLERRTLELGLEGRVVFRGECGDAARDAAFRACDVFVLTPFEAEDGDVEGFGIVYLEAGACGKPVVGSRSGGIPDAVVDGETGLLVESRSVKEIASAVERLWSDEALWHRMGEAGRAAYAAHAPRVVGRQLADAFVEAVSADRGLGRQGAVTR
jgi:glycosyltransferase involved in cell wall biosynthesis